MALPNAAPSFSRGQRRQPDPAQAAIALQEWSSKKWVWVPSPESGYVAGWVVKEEGELSTVSLQAGGNLLQVASIDLRPVNPPSYDGAEDIANLTYLNEASVVHNLKTRYFEDSIYTYSGLFLVAVNPYKNLSIYSAANVERYKNRRRDENPPHVFAVAEQAWQSMLENMDQSQSILVTGESGAGKTENTKKIIQYLAAISADPLPQSTSIDSLATRSGVLQRQAHHASGKKGLGHLERQILEANPILEAFGNAQTVKNNNSSRFGKFVRIFFNPIGGIAGATVDWYLLEKSRVTGRSEQERSFHVFFQLLRGADPELKAKLLLSGKSTDYEYLAHSRQDVDGMDDREEFRLLKAALNTVGFTAAEQFDLWKVTAAILHLGNVAVGGDRSDQAHLRNPSQLEIICHLLGLRDASVLLNALVRPKVKAGREWVVQARTAKQVVDELAALAKSLYEKMFGAIVDRINTALGRPATKTFIGVLDIAGFEIFDVNGFEQLLINLTNEKLQQFFNHRMFILEQEEYSREQIAWEFRSFGLELQPTIDLIESNAPMGILSCLDDACIMPKATDQSFTEALDRLAAAAPTTGQYGKYKASRIERGFTVSHYAGNVEYRTDGWLDKNRDPLSDTVAALLAHSSDPFIASMFVDYADVGAEAALEGPRTRVRRGAFRTVGQRHKDQLAYLMSQLHETQPHFVRCIVPNTTKSAGIIDAPLVLEQLACNGVLEGIRIARLGFPNRLPFAEFRRRFEILVPRQAVKGFVDGAEASRRILTSLDLDPRTYQLGLTKVFFKAGILAEIEERRDDVLSVIFTSVQAACRRFVARRQAVKILHRAAAVRTIQRNARIYNQLRAWPWWPLFQRVRPLLAAARNDDEVRRKEEELVAAKEQAEREARERGRLEAVQAKLEEDRVKMEAVLASERAMTVEMELLLTRSKEREAALEGDLEIVDVQLDKALALKSRLEGRIADLDAAVVNSNALVTTLQEEQRAWAAKEAEWASQTSVKTAEWERILAERDQGRAKAERLAAELADRGREHDRLTASLAGLEARLATEVREASEARKKLGVFESEVLAATQDVARLEKEKRDAMGQLGSLDVAYAKLSRDLATITTDRDSAAAKARQLEVDLAATSSRVAASTRDLDAARSTQSKTDGDIASLKALLEAKVSDHEQQSRLNAIKEAEVQALREKVSQAADELATTQRNATNDSTRLRQDLDRSRSEATTLSTKNQELQQDLSRTSKQLAVTSQKADELEQKQQAHDLHIEVVRTQAAEDTLRERSLWEKERTALELRLHSLEDQAVDADRRRADSQRDAEALKVLLEAEQATVKAREEAVKLRDQKLNQQHSVLADLDKINGELRRELHETQGRLRLAEDKGGKLVVEHIRVLEEAQRLQKAEMVRMREDDAIREARLRTLERQNGSLTQSLEDLQHEREKERRDRWQGHPVKDNTADQLARQLASERELRQGAEINVGRLRGEIQQQQLQIDGLVHETKELRHANTLYERELNSIAASDVVEPTSVRRMLDSRAGNGVPNPNRNSYGIKPLPQPLPPPPPPHASSSTMPIPTRRRNYE